MVMVARKANEMKPYPSAGFSQKVLIKQIPSAERKIAGITVRRMKEVAEILLRTSMRKPIQMKYKPMPAMTNNPSEDRNPSTESSNHPSAMATTKETINMPKRNKPQSETRIPMVLAAN